MEVFEEYATKHIGPVLLILEIAVAHHTPVTERLRINIGKNVGFLFIDAGTYVIVSKGGAI